MKLFCDPVRSQRGQTQIILDPSHKRPRGSGISTTSYIFIHPLTRGPNATCRKWTGEWVRFGNTLRTSAGVPQHPCLPRTISCHPKDLTSSGVPAMGHQSGSGSARMWIPTTGRTDHAGDFTRSMSMLICKRACDEPITRNQGMDREKWVWISGMLRFYHVNTANTFGYNSSQ